MVIHLVEPSGGGVGVGNFIFHLLVFPLVFHAKETMIKNVNIFYILAGFEARWSPDCYGNIYVIFANEISDKNVIFTLVLMGFHRIFEARRSISDVIGKYQICNGFGFTLPDALTSN